MSDYISHDHEHDGIDRRGFLKCMAWAGTGVLWTISGGVLTSKVLGAVAAEAAGDFSFVQISDSHIGLTKRRTRMSSAPCKKRSARSMACQRRRTSFCTRAT